MQIQIKLELSAGVETNVELDTLMIILILHQVQGNWISALKFTSQCKRCVVRHSPAEVGQFKLITTAGVSKSYLKLVLSIKFFNSHQLCCFSLNKQLDYKRKQMK